MADRRRLELMVLVKATPALSGRLEESMCVAGMTLGEDAKWVRLHPVPFRDLDDPDKFKKYQMISAEVIRKNDDRRPESRQPIEGSIVVGETIGTQHAWATRRERVALLGERTACDLHAANQASGSGPSTPSLAVVRTAGPPKLIITKRDQAEVAKVRLRAKEMAGRRTLFQDQNAPDREFKVIEWDFHYRYRCLAPDCKGHKQGIIDWEISALYWKVQRDPNWPELIRKKFEDELWAESRDTVLFLGNMHQKPWNFLVLGVFWPPKSPMQLSMI